MSSSIPVQDGGQHGGQRLNHGAHPGVVCQPGLPIDDFQGVVKKVGVDLGLQRLDLRPLCRLLLQIGLLELLFQLDGGGIEIVIQPFKLCIGGGLLNLIAPPAGLDLHIGLGQGFGGVGDMAVEQGNYHQQQGKHHQSHPHHGPAQPGGILPEVIALREDGQGHGMPVGIGAVADFPIRFGGLGIFGLADGAVVHGEAQAAGPGNALDALQYNGAVQQHGNGGVGLKLAAQDIACHIDVAVQVVKTEVGVRILHGLHNPGGRAFHLYQQVVAGGAPAEHIGAGLGTVPPVPEEGSPIPALPGEILGHIVVGGPVELGTVSILGIAAKGASDDAVVGHRL